MPPSKATGARRDASPGASAVTYPAPVFVHSFTHRHRVKTRRPTRYVPSVHTHSLPSRPASSKNPDPSTPRRSLFLSLPARVPRVKPVLAHSTLYIACPRRCRLVEPSTQETRKRKRDRRSSRQASCTASPPQLLNCLHPSLSLPPLPPSSRRRCSSLPHAMAAAAPTKAPATMRAVQYDACGGGAEALKVTALFFLFPPSPQPAPLLTSLQRRRGGDAGGPSVLADKRFLPSFLSAKC